MNREYAKQEIRRRWREIMPGITDQAPGKMNGEKSWVCPLCGSGSGPHGTGITRNPKSRDGNSLHCFGCDYSGDMKEEDLILGTDVKLVEDYKGNQLLLFASQWSINWVQEKNKNLTMSEFGGARE